VVSIAVRVGFQVLTVQAKVVLLALVARVQEEAKVQVVFSVVAVMVVMATSGVMQVTRHR
jgi:hypothetical protein